jgi:trimeric autotransporter adhesin
MTKLRRRRTTTPRYLALVVFVCLSLLCGCGGGSFGPGVSASSVTLQSIQISPSGSSLSIGQTEQFTATGHYSDRSSKDITNSALWISSNTSIAGISNSGLATSHATGSATVTATLSGVVGRGSITVVAAALVSIVISPSATSIFSGQTAQFRAMGAFSNGTQQDITSSVSWTSGNVAVASINLGGIAGFAKGLSPGVSTISASSGSISSTASLTVTVTNATLVSIAITPADAVLSLGTHEQYVAAGTFSDGSLQDITNSVTWASSKTSVLSIAGGGLATARAMGSVTISATSGSISASTTATVQSAALSFITIRPAQKKIAPFTSQQFQGIGTYADGSTHNVTRKVSWTSSNTTVATIGNRGLAKALSPGTTTITATLGSISASTTLEVSNATIVSVSVAPTGRSIAPETKLPFVATGFFSDHTTQVITRDSTWASDNHAVATLGSGSTVTAVGPGTANISATFTGVAGSAPLYVSAATLSSISVIPPTALLAPATSVDCVAIGTFSAGSTQIITSLVTWSSSAPELATVSSNGKVTAQSAGTAIISAQLGVLRADSAIVVDSSPLTSLQVTPQIMSTAPQTVVAFRATGTFADGDTQDLTTSVLWTSSPGSVATISNDTGTMGQATGLEPGTATITALFNGQVGTAYLTVNGATSTALLVSPPSCANLAQNGFTQFCAVADFSDGTARDVTPWITWTSSSANLASVTANAVARSTSVGTTTVTDSEHEWCQRNSCSDGSLTDNSRHREYVLWAESIQDPVLKERMTSSNFSCI